MKTKIVIGVPSGDTVHADFAMSLAAITAYTATNCKDIELAIENPKSSIVTKGRYQCVKRALELEAHKLLFLDSDMIFPPDIVERLLSHKKDIVGCNYVTRTIPMKPTARHKFDGKPIGHAVGTEAIKEVGYLATGCMMIDMGVFEDIPEPYFRIGWDEKKKVITGEDYNFCDDVKELKFKIHCDHEYSPKLKHIGTARFGL